MRYVDYSDNFTSRKNSAYPNDTISSTTTFQSLFSCIGLSSRQNGQNIREVILKRAEEHNFAQIKAHSSKLNNVSSANIFNETNVPISLSKNKKIYLEKSTN